MPEFSLFDNLGKYVGAGDRAVDLAKSLSQGSAPVRDLAAINAEIAQTRGDLKGINDAVGSGNMTSDVGRAKFDRLQQKLNSLKQEAGNFQSTGTISSSPIRGETPTAPNAGPPIQYPNTAGAFDYLTAQPITSPRNPDTGYIIPQRDPDTGRMLAPETGPSPFRQYAPGAAAATAVLGTGAALAPHMSSPPVSARADSVVSPQYNDSGSATDWAKMHQPAAPQYNDSGSATDWARLNSIPTSRPPVSRADSFPASAPEPRRPSPSAPQGRSQPSAQDSESFLAKILGHPSYPPSSSVGPDATTPENRASFFLEQADRAKSGYASGGQVASGAQGQNKDAAMHKALEIIHHLISRG